MRMSERLLGRHGNWLNSRRHLWLQYYINGERELSVLKQYVDKRKTALDIGGNIGVYAYHLSRLARDVVCFEPNPKFIQRITELRIPNCRVEQIALSSQNSIVPLRIPHVDGREDLGMASIEQSVVADKDLSRSIDVPTRRLDDLQIAEIGFIKIDVEGHEEQVLEGAKNTIICNKPVLLIEIEERHNTGGVERITGFLQQLGYRGFYYEQTRRKPLSDFDHKLLQSDVPKFGLKSHNRRSYNYVNNFFFVPSTS